jgi:hypothetical protein
MTDTASPAGLNLQMLYSTLEDSPTVEAGLITVLVETRHVLERVAVAYPDITEIRLLAEQLDNECAKITPWQTPRSSFMSTCTPMAVSRWTTPPTKRSWRLSGTSN